MTIEQILLAGNAILIPFGLYMASRKYTKNIGLIGSEPIEATVIESKHGSEAKKINNSPLYICFNYTYNNIEYKSTYDVRLSTNHKHTAERYPVGSKLNIYVSPSNPEFTMQQKPSKGEAFFKALTPYAVIMFAFNYGIIQIAK